MKEEKWQEDGHEGEKHLGLMRKDTEHRCADKPEVRRN